MSRPLWGKGNRASGGSGELALINRLLHKLATYPHHHRATNPHYTCKAIQHRKRVPLSDPLTGATSPQRARLIL